MNKASKFLSAILPIAFTACAVKPSELLQAPAVFTSYVDARDDILPGRPTGTSGTFIVKDMSIAEFRSEPHMSVGRKCNADHSICKAGVVTAEIKYTTRHVGSEWIMEGDLKSAVARTATQTIKTLTSSQSFTDSIPAEVPLIDDEAVADKHFRWVIQAGTSLDVDGPVGTHFHAEVGSAL